MKPQDTKENLRGINLVIIPISNQRHTKGQGKPYLVLAGSGNPII